MSNITNNFEPGSVTMNAGSSMNGDVHIGNVYNGQAEPQADATLNDSSGVGRGKAHQEGVLYVGWQTVQHRFVQLRQGPVQLDGKRRALRKAVAHIR